MTKRMSQMSLLVGLALMIGCGAGDLLDPSDIEDTVSGKDDVVRPVGTYESTSAPTARGDIVTLNLHADRTFERSGAFRVTTHPPGPVIEQKGTYKFTKSGDKRYIRFSVDGLKSSDRYQYTLSGKTLKLRADGSTRWQKLQAATVTTDFLSCTKDADCHKVVTGCCGLDLTAVNDADDYRSSLHCGARGCLTANPDASPTVAICNDESKCELTLPTEYFCGVRTANPHQCPSGYVCWGPNLASDGGGFCHKECGGFAGIGCDQDGFVCEDNPLDDCDPAHGGADCGGICKRHRINN